MFNDPSKLEADVETILGIPVISSILQVVCSSTGMGFAAVARVTDKKWIACAVKDDINFGLIPGGELKLETTLCHEIEQSHQAVVIDNVKEDKIYCGHPTPALYGFQSYISVPILLKNGEFFGTLCAIDPKPARLNTPEVIATFTLFADLIGFYLTASDQLAQTEAQLLEEHHTAELREQFIAILGHDLRNPVNAVQNSVQILQQLMLPESAKLFVNIIQSSCVRITGLINNIMDFASGRMGGGIVLNRNADEPVETLLNQVIAEANLARPNCRIETCFELTQPVNCDGKRIAQLFSNLLTNAQKYGDKTKPVVVQAISNPGAFILTVSNEGNEIPEAVKERLFQPFFRGDVLPDQQGLGLGLYIVSEIARAHGGTISVQSSLGKTSFTLHIPQ